jgi:hypothetical protein
MPLSWIGKVGRRIIQFVHGAASYKYGVHAHVAKNIIDLPRLIVATFGCNEEIESDDKTDESNPLAS